MSFWWVLWQPVIVKIPLSSVAWWKHACGYGYEHYQIKPEENIFKNYPKKWSLYLFERIFKNKKIEFFTVQSII